LGVFGAFVGLFFTGGGLGGVVEISKTQQRVDKIFAGLILAALLGIGLFVFVNGVSWFALRKWHASERVN
jgi:ABC-type nitrate/sulfonate/bicarbonate transport system permease component